MDFELSHWDGRHQTCGLSCSPRYVLDTVLHHEQNTNGLYKAQKYMELLKGDKILEIGCNGFGFGSLFAQDGRYVVGLDLLSEPLYYARKSINLINKRDFSKEQWGEDWCHPPSYKIDCDFTQAEGTHIPFRDGSFDTVAVPDVIEHFPVHLREKAVQEGVRVVKPGGRFLISTIIDLNDPNNPNWMNEVEDSIHPFGLLDPNELTEWVENTGVDIFCHEIKWFGNDKFIKQIFIGADKN